MATSLDAEARRDLRGLAKDVAESVARHLVAAGVLVDEDPAQALAHARYARRRASRIAVVREAAGIAAYHAGEWAEALSDLRAARRMGGGPGHLAVMADIERALGRPERAVELARGPEVAELGRVAQIELAIVAAGARRDLGELDAAVVALQIPELQPARRDPWSPRLFYAYADNLLAAGRESDAVQWFVHATDADENGETDAAARLAELSGETPAEDDEIEFDVEELAVDEHVSADDDVDHDDQDDDGTGADAVLEDGDDGDDGSTDAAEITDDEDEDGTGADAVLEDGDDGDDGSTDAAEITDDEDDDGTGADAVLEDGDDGSTDAAEIVDEAVEEDGGAAAPIESPDPVGEHAAAGKESPAP